MNTTTLPQGAAVQPRTEDAAYARVTWRLIPLLFICYVAAYLDRVNVGFAKLQMLSDLQFSEAIYGLGAGIFFIGYFVFEVPSNLLMHRFGVTVAVDESVGVMVWVIVGVMVCVIVGVMVCVIVGVMVCVTLGVPVLEAVPVGDWVPVGVMVWVIVGLPLVVP